MRSIPALILALSVVSPAAADDDGLSGLFARERANGTLVISSLDGATTYVHDSIRANTRFSPASTFKILNSLIVLEEGAISGLDEVLVWDGRRRDVQDWNRDHTLGSAFKSSCVWCYQELARRVGAQKYRERVAGAAYGVLKEPFAGTSFWLDGSLTISAAEQVEFLRKVVRRSLPYRESTYDSLRQIMLVEQTPDYTIRAKTGWAASVTPQVGWYVGYVERQDATWIFALNVDIAGDRELPLRQRLARLSLQEKGIIE